MDKGTSGPICPVECFEKNVLRITSYLSSVLGRKLWPSQVINISVLILRLVPKQILVGRAQPGAERSP